ncbi:MAG: hypothetical protein HY040_20350 [Planctomycetes bacterium]|nr:hypothetical protein [Planctomycetota bacterium]
MQNTPDSPQLRPAFPKPRSRLRRWLARGVLGVAILAVLAFGIGAVVTFFADADLTDIYAKLDRDDPNWRLEDLEAHRKELPAEENSALHVLSTSRAIGGLVTWRSSQTYGKLFENLPPQARLNFQQRKYLNERLQSRQKALAEARKLKDMPEGRYPLAYSVDFISTLLPNRSDLWVNYDPLKWDATLRVDAGDADGAMEACRALLNAYRSVGDEPFLTMQYVRYFGQSALVETLERVLAQGQPSEGALKEMQRALAGEIAEPTLWYALRGERAGFHRFMTAQAEGKTSAAAVAGKGAGFDVFGLVPGHNIKEHGRLLLLLNEMVEATKLPLHEQEAAFAAIDARIGVVGSWQALLVPKASGVAGAYRRAQALLRSAMTAMAAERYRLAHKDWPKTLDDLVAAKLLDAVPDDPFVVGPIKLKHRADGITIYSFGFDRVDNDGNIDHERSERAVGFDIGIRLWNVSARRQAPMPTVTMDAKDK